MRSLKLYKVNPVVPASRKRWRWGRIIGASLPLLLLLVLGDYWLYPLLAPVGGHSLDRGRNGIWLHYSWYFGQHSDAETKQLAM